MPDIDFPEKFQCLFTPKRYKVFYGGRGGAKSWSFARALLILGMQKPLRVLCVREMQKSIADSVHKILKDQIDAMGLGGFYEVLQAQIRGANGTEFAFEGIAANVSKVKSYEGIDVCWVEEADKVTKDSWDVLIPTIRKTGSEIWIGFNPNLEEDYTYQHFVVDPPKNSFIVKVSWRDNPFFAESELFSEMMEMKEKRYDDYLHIYEGNCKVLLDGAVYADEVREVLAGERITSVPYDRVFGVSAYFDLGRNDKTAIWFYQYVAREHRLIDYYENEGKAIEHYIDILQKRGYTYNEIGLPHDATHKTIVHKLSVEGIFKEKGFKVRIIPKLTIAEGINAVRTILPLCVFDKQKTQLGIKALKEYKYEIDDTTKLRSLKPVHNEFSHGADAFRYLAVGVGSPKRGKLESLIGKFKEKESRFVYSGPPLGWLNQ